MKGSDQWFNKLALQADGNPNPNPDPNPNPSPNPDPNPSPTPTPTPIPCPNQADGKIVLHVEIGAPKRHIFGFKTMKVAVDRKHLEKDTVYSHEGMFQVRVRVRARVRVS